MVTIGSFACVSGAVLLYFPQILPPQLLTGVLACGNLLISVGVYFSQSTTSVSPRRRKPPPALRTKILFTSQSRVRS